MAQPRPPSSANFSSGPSPGPAGSQPAQGASQGPIAQQSTAAPSIPNQNNHTTSKKRRNNRGGKRKKGRRQSFLPPDENSLGPVQTDRSVEAPTSSGARPQMYNLNSSGNRNLSETSLDSEALLDHREHQPMRPRRDSKAALPSYMKRSNHDLPSQTRSYRSETLEHGSLRRGSTQIYENGRHDGEENAQTSDRTPLLGAMYPEGTSPARRSGYGMFGRQNLGGRRGSESSRDSRRGMGSRQQSFPKFNTAHDVNNPPSVPGSPRIGADMGYDDVIFTEALPQRPPDSRIQAIHDQLIDIDTNEDAEARSDPSTPPQLRSDQRRHTISLPAEEDVCFPTEEMSTIGEEDYLPHDGSLHTPQEPRRRRHRRWPDLHVLNEWSVEEKEERSEGIRAKKISEPVLVGGRLRPQQRGWQRAEEDLPYRFTYFNEDFPSTIHSQTISELLQPGQDFRELFIPEPPELSESDLSSEDEESTTPANSGHRPSSPNVDSRAVTRHSSLIGGMKTESPRRSRAATPTPSTAQEPQEKPKRYGERPTFWLDVLSPTDTEMRVISKAFGIHPLTAEDIMMQEAREKVELFPKYYFVNYRTFEQDVNSEDYLEPVNMYVVVFPEGIISFHFSMSPHPANVRRRIRQLKEYLQVSSDWISYALIDDITDVFAPLIQTIEEEVDQIDEAILRLLYDKKDDITQEKERARRECDEQTENGEASSGGGDMLRRVGEARKRVMMLYRLLGNKADVIKGFAKRCNERWQIAPKSDIGLYLGDIQDHILTMTSNLGHYETLLSRAHSNFLAQMNMRMNERQEQTADVLGKLTVLGTIVLPMNIITGMWGMNVLVPGQDVDNLYWFWSITAGLFIFGISCFFIAKRVYGIV